MSPKEQQEKRKMMIVRPEYVVSFLRLLNTTLMDSGKFDKMSGAVGAIGFVIQAINQCDRMDIEFDEIVEAAKMLYPMLEYKRLVTH